VVVIGLSFPDELFDEESVQNTPARIERMQAEFAEWRNWELEEGKGVFERPDYNDLVLIRGIDFTSFCSHHILPFRGQVSVAYIPGGWIVGLSKIPRVVRKFASRPQLQERMTDQIADYLMTKIPQVKGVMVVCEADHMCMQVRGARMTGTTGTSAIRGVFAENASLKAETLELMTR